jgi:ureidoacrylate peracid hydrolase
MSSSTAEEFDAATALAHVRMLSGLREKTRPDHTALLVIDMQNDFLAVDGLMAREGWDMSEAQRMATRLPVLIAAARGAGVFVVFVRNVYSSERNFYLSDVWLEQAARRRPGGYTRFPVCAEGSWGGDFYNEIRPQLGDPIVTKHRYNGFHNTDLDTLLRARGIRTIVFAGVSTHCCVESTARDAFMRDYYVVVVDDATATYSKEAHETALKNIDSLFGEVTTIAALREMWKGGNT